MQAVGFTEQISLVLPLFEAVMPHEEGFVATSYPYPSLKSLGRSESREFEAITLENDFLRVQWVVELGGRMVSCVDKRTGLELIPAAQLTPSLRGDGLRLGISIQVPSGARLNDTGPVDVAQLESEDSAGFVLAETAAGSELSWHLFVRLADNSAAIDYELRVVNRSAVRSALIPNLRIPSGFAIDERWDLSESTARSRIHPPHIGPLGTATLFARIIPLAPGRSASRSSENVAVVMNSEGWTLYPAQAFDATVLIGAQGQTFEAQLGLDPAVPLQIPVADLPAGANEIAIRDSAGKFILESALAFDSPDWSPVRDWPESAKPSDWVNDPLLGPVAAVKAGDIHMAQEEWDECELAIDHAVSHMPESPLAWWRKSALGRLTGRGDEVDLPNAHYLAPLEPLLRAEAFLNQSPEMSREPSPLVLPLADRPEQLVEVAVRWLEVGRPDQATRWIDESLRHAQVPMLFYLQAYAFLSARRMEVEIPNLLTRAAQIGIQPPFPYRDLERTALTELSERFPDDLSLNLYAKIGKVGAD